MLIQQLEGQFQQRSAFTTNDIVNFFNSLQPGIPRATINWRLHDLVNRDVIARIGKGKFTWGSTNEFVPEMGDRLQEIHHALKQQFPFITYSLWQAGNVKEFNQHIPKVNFILADIEKDAAGSVFLFLKEKYTQVFYKPSKDLLDNYINDLDQPVIIRHLISAAPVRVKQGIPTVTIEKLMVDIFSDREFDYLRGNELYLIFRNIFDRYTVNLSKLARYADRKGKKEEITGFISDHQLANI